MPSEFDLLVRDTLMEMSQPGQMFELASVERSGVEMPIFKNAPGNLGDYFAFFCMQHGDTEFLVDGDIRLSFAETYAAARALAGALIDGHGVKPGDHVAIAARNSANWLILYMAIAMAGAVTVKLNGFWQGEELLAGITDVNCTLVFADRQRADRIAAAGAKCPADVILFTHNVPPAEGFADTLALGGGAETALPSVDTLDPATILFTSGSTGKSKGAVSTHQAVVQGTMSFVCAFAVVAEVMRKNGGIPDVQPCALPALPFFHVTASVVGFLVSFAIGRKVVIMKKWDAEEAMRLIEKEKVTYFVGVPLMSMEIYTHPKMADYDLSSCFSVSAGGAPRPVEHVRRLKEAMNEGCFPIIGYGLTETNAVGASNQNENYLARPDSTGRATPPIIEIAILDDDGQPVPQGERGEVCIRTAANFSEYWQNPEATAAAFTRDGFFRSGDIGLLDEEGYLYIVDRKKDIIIRGGENISCQEVEDAIYAHPDVAEACVFGVADERLGEVPAMVVVPKNDAKLASDDLRAWLGDHIAKFKIPQHGWISTEALPRLGTAKIDRVSIARHHRELLEKSN